jgi:hypothetical protein
MPECNVEGCADEAIAALVGEDGYETAYRCRDCLVFDLGLGSSTHANNSP